MYYLLPFRYERMHPNHELLVNELGDYLFVEQGTAHRIANKEIQPSEELYKDLLANFFISTTPFPALIDNMATRLRTKKAFLDDFTTLHIFVLTLRCNQNCVYCQASSKESCSSIYDMKEADLDHAVDLMFKSPAPSVTMEFQGGEPSLTFPLIKRAVDKAEALKEVHGKEVTYVLCTNSVSHSDELLDYCKIHDILISTSLDGPEHVHNQNRGKSDSYARVITGINKARELLGHDRVSALMTTSELSLDYPKEIVDNYIENGFNSLFVRPLNPYGMALEKTDWDNYESRFIDFYKTTLDYIIDLNHQGTFFVEELSAIILRKILTPFSTGFVDLQSPAGIINGVIVYNYDGYVYCSDESRMLSEHQDNTFRLGHVSDQYESLFYGQQAQQLALIWNNETLAGCADCAFRTYCGADPVRNHSMQQDQYGYRPNASICTQHKAIIAHLFDLLLNDKERVLPIFKQWINKNEN